jgi:hypothetical protein
VPRKPQPPSVEQLESAIHEVRGHRVMLDADLAAIYGVETRAPTQAVRRNSDRFPSDSAFQLTNQEVANLKSQIVISSLAGCGGRRKRFWAFTEHGAVMAATVLRTPGAIDLSVHVVRAFVRMRRALVIHTELADELRKLKRGLAAKFNQYNEHFWIVFVAIDHLIAAPEPKSGKIGFRRDDE